MEEKHNASRNIIIAIIVIAIIAILGYLVYASTLDNDTQAIPDEVEDMVDENNEFDEVGSYTGMETYGDEEATGTIELVLKKDNTAILVLAYDDTKEYTGTYTKDGDNIILTADTEEKTTDNSVLEENANNNTTGQTTDKTSNETFNFTVNDDTLYYTSKETNEEIKLDKVDRNTLQYIEE